MILIWVALFIVVLVVVYLYQYNKSGIADRLKGDKSIDSILASSKKISLVGISGSGKSTLGGELSELLDVAFIELDELRHGPNWQPFPDDVMRDNLIRRMKENEHKGYIIDGGYKFLQSIVSAECKLVIFLDYPAVVLYPRLLWRIIKRCYWKIELWNGNVETWYSQFCTSESLLLWVWKFRSTKRHYYSNVLPQMYPDITLITLRSPKETEHLLKHWRSLVQNK